MKICPFVSHMLGDLDRVHGPKRETQTETVAANKSDATVSDNPVVILSYDDNAEAAVDAGDSWAARRSGGASATRSGSKT